MKAMSTRSIALFSLLLALIITVPLISGCEMVASYLIYEWIQDEFGDGDGDGEEPVIKRVLADREEIHTGEAVLLEVEAEDDEDDANELEYYWFASAGTMVSPTNRITVWNTPDEPGTVTVSVIVTDTDENQDSATIEIEVLE